MIRRYIVTVLLFSWKTLFSQSDTARFNVQYDVVVNDSISKMYSELFVLSVGNNSTSFMSTQHNLQNGKQNNIIIDRTSQRGIIIDARNQEPPKNFIRTKMFRDFSSNKFKTVEEILYRYLIEEEIKPINWSIAEDTLSIMGYTCQRATCKFLGRDYEAYFTAQIPLQLGPWKLGGLPGLIVKAKDKVGEFSFMLRSIEKLTAQSQLVIITQPSDKYYKQVSRKDLENNFIAMQEDRQGYINSQTNLNFEFKPNGGVQNENKLKEKPKATLPIFYRIEKQ